MTDEPTHNGTATAGAFDDDRLLACALGIEDDPELLEAAADDTVLAGRLDAMRREVAAVEDQVARAVPAPDAEYVDLSDARWSSLRPYLEPPPTKRRHGRASRRLRVAVPVAALAVLALVAGLAVIDRGGDAALVDAERAGGDAMQLSTSAVAPPTFAEQLDGFAVVVLARARAAAGALQRFAVVRVFKGEAPRILRLRVGDSPATEGRLHLLLLHPVAVVDAESFGTEEAEPPAVTKGGDDGPGRQLVAAYSYEGEPAVARELPAGTDPQSVALP